MLANPELVHTSINRNNPSDKNDDKKTIGIKRIV